jgi:hypothetical protein
MNGVIAASCFPFPGVTLVSLADDSFPYMSTSSHSFSVKCPSVPVATESALALVCAFQISAASDVWNQSNIPPEQLGFLQHVPIRRSKRFVHLVKMRFSMATAVLIFAAACALVVATPITAPSALQSKDDADVSLPMLTYDPEALTATTILDEGGLRNISYFINARGLAIIDLDIIYGTEEQLHEAEARAQDMMASGDAYVVPRAYVERNVPWPGAKVHYRFSDSQSESYSKPSVDEAIKRWKTGAPYLQFIREGNGQWYKPGSSVLTIYAGKDRACNSDIGYSPTHDPGMDIGPLCMADEVTHEFGHVLGMFLTTQHISLHARISLTHFSGLHHEMLRPDRDHFIQILWDNVDKTIKDPFPKDDVKNPNRDWSSPYDINSIMQYRANANGIKGKTTLQSKTSIPVPVNNGAWPSPGDLKAVCGIYTCECPQATKSNNCK